MTQRLRSSPKSPTSPMFMGIFLWMVSAWCANTGHHSTLPPLLGIEDFTMSPSTLLHPLPNCSLDMCLVSGTLVTSTTTFVPDFALRPGPFAFEKFLRPEISVFENFHSVLFVCEAHARLRSSTFRETTTPVPLAYTGSSQDFGLRLAATHQFTHEIAVLHGASGFPAYQGRVSRSQRACVIFESLPLGSPLCISESPSSCFLRASRPHRAGSQALYAPLTSPDLAPSSKFTPRSCPYWVFCRGRVPPPRLSLSSGFTLTLSFPRHSDFPRFSHSHPTRIIFEPLVLADFTSLPSLSPRTIRLRASLSPRTRVILAVLFLDEHTSLLRLSPR
jgi:hypothetical protein